MNTSTFALTPFGISHPEAPLAITGAITRRGPHLDITYNLTGRLNDLIIAAPDPAPVRRWLLWESTCFEMFLAVPGQASYWEVNLSPAGHWNVFRLDSYRQGIAEEPAFQTLPFIVQRQRERLTLSLTFDVSAVIPADQPLEAGISAVLQHQDGSLTYWALTHPAEGPDFHHRRGFVIKI